MPARPVVDTQILSWSERASQLLFIKLGIVPHKVLVRVTGGCANMEEEDQQGVIDLFGAAFAGFRGAMLIGGTRLIRGEDPTDIFFGITEVGAHIHYENPDSYIVGVTPCVLATIFKEEIPLLVVEHFEVSDVPHGLTTIVHPDVNLAIHVSEKLTNRNMWYDEAHFCADIAFLMRRFAEWDYLTVVYNGGEVTEYEVLQTALTGKPILIIQGSGRAADKLAADQTFLTTNPNVTVCQKTPESMREALIRLGAIHPTP